MEQNIVSPIKYKRIFLKSLKLKQEDINLINSYLFEVKKRSDQEYKNHKSLLYNFFNYVAKSILQINSLDILDYLKYLDNRNISYNSKKTYRSYLNSFFNFIQSNMLVKNINYINPMPPKNIFEFSKNYNDIKKLDIQKCLEKEQIKNILIYLKNNYYNGRNIKYQKVFILFTLAVCTGARQSELRTIRLKDININERYFQTGFIKNARKSTLKSNKSLVFFFPKKFKPYLNNYILKLIKNDKKYLFPGNKNEFMTKANVDYYYVKIRKKLGFHFTMHYFRHTLITNLIKNKCPLEIRELLLNHSSNSTQTRFYTHLSIEERRNYYDEFFPYYRLVPFF